MTGWVGEQVTPLLLYPLGAGGGEAGLEASGRLSRPPGPLKAPRGKRSARRGREAIRSQQGWGLRWGCGAWRGEEGCPQAWQARGLTTLPSPTRPTSARQLGAARPSRCGVWHRRMRQGDWL